MLTTRAGTTELESVVPLTGATTVVADFGIDFRGLEVDTDDTIYGLAADGGLYRVALSPPSATLLGTLPPLSSVACFQYGWSGLAFRLPALAIDVSPVCAGVPNSTGLAATLTVTDRAGTGVGVLTFRASDLPPQHAALLLTALGVGNTPVGVGTLCIGAQVVRVFPPTVADANGEARFTLDLSSVPGHGLVLSGDSLTFQALFRDLHPTATVNLTSALRVLFY